MKKMLFAIAVVATMLTGCGNSKMTTEEVKIKAKENLETVGLEGYDYVEVGNWYDVDNDNKEYYIGYYGVDAVNEYERLGGVIERRVHHLVVCYDYNGEVYWVRSTSLYPIVEWYVPEEFED